MRADRTIMRLTLPPALAFGLVTVLSAPLSASSALADTGSSAGRVPALSAPAGEANIAVSIGAVSFTKDVSIVNGHLHTPVLLAVPGVTATTSVVDASTDQGCEAELAPGDPAWLDCAVTIAPGSSPRIVVTLSDGRTATKAIAAG